MTILLLPPLLHGCRGVPVGEGVIPSLEVEVKGTVARVVVANLDAVRVGGGGAVLSMIVPGVGCVPLEKMMVVGGLVVLLAEDGGGGEGECITVCRIQLSNADTRIQLASPSFNSQLI